MGTRPLVFQVPSLTRLMVENSDTSFMRLVNICLQRNVDVCINVSLYSTVQLHEYSHMIFVFGEEKGRVGEGINGWGGGGNCEDRDAGGLGEKRSSEGIEETSTRIQRCLITSDVKMCTGICQWVGNKYDFSCCLKDGICLLHFGVKQRKQNADLNP